MSFLCTYQKDVNCTVRPFLSFVSTSAGKGKWPEKGGTNFNWCFKKKRVFCQPRRGLGNVLNLLITIKNYSYSHNPLQVGLTG